MKKSRVGWLAILIGVVLVAIALVFWLKNYVESADAATASAHMVAKIQSQIKMQSEIEMPQQVENPDSENTKDFLLNKKYLGILAIPTLDLELAVQMKCSASLLRSAPCLYAVVGENSDRLIICGHNYRSHFGKLKKLAVGDEIYFTDMGGEKTSYKVIESTIISQDDFAALTDENGALTLFTCTPNRLNRVVIRCGLH
ncbi:MAG: sortase [Clostridiales bacterium]